MDLDLDLDCDNFKMKRLRVVTRKQRDTLDSPLAHPPLLDPWDLVMDTGLVSDTSHLSATSRQAATVQYSPSYNSDAGD